jgi:hypothetical protein
MNRKIMGYIEIVDQKRHKWRLAVDIGVARSACSSSG